MLWDIIFYVGFMFILDGFIFRPTRKEQVMFGGYVRLTYYGLFVLGRSDLQEVSRRPKEAGR